MVRALFPGSFDPIHFGHVDIASRAARLFDEVVVGVYDRPLKTLMFSPEERMALVIESFRKQKNVRVMGYNGLTVNFCKQIDAQVIVRGLRVFSDFEFEFRMALANARLSPGIESVVFITREEHTFLSSSSVREIAILGGDVSSMVPAHVSAALKEKIAEIGDQQSNPFGIRI
ncbi:MAG: pantetheine-phosphate adenylyltransferase [Anaerolineales bacterium]|nr:pantetheine-phosphate adenylyltransferase [Anaerolineales bacterium]